MQLPDGPASLETLFQWPQRNAKKLFEDSEESLNTFRALSGHKIRINDSYSGTGTGSWTLHHQHKALVSGAPSLYCLLVVACVCVVVFIVCFLAPAFNYAPAQTNFSLNFLECNNRVAVWRQ